MLELQNYIGGAWAAGQSGETLTAVNPADLEGFATFPASTEADVDAAVAAARAAAPEWAALSLAERLEQLHAFAAAVEALADEIAEAEHREMGKPLAVAHQFIGAGLGGFRAALADALTYPFVEKHAASHGTAEIQRMPLGVVAEIVPWNFTVPQTLINLGAVLAAGNTAVIKPSEKATPSASVLFAANTLPAGVLNLVLGDGRAGRALSEHPDVNLVIFTGSVPTGRAVAKAAGANLNRAILELGGKDAAIVDTDVNVAQVAMDVAAGCFVNSGQICTSMERIYVHRDVADEFIAELCAATEVFCEGGPAAIGPLVDLSQAAIVRRHVNEAVALGATIVAGGRDPEAVATYFPPTVLTGITPNMEIAREETFGPVAPITVVDSFDEAMRLAVESDFGLAATVYSQNEANLAAARQLPVALLWLNGWQGSNGVRASEPTGVSGMGAVGGSLAYDAATRPMTVFVPATVSADEEEEAA